MSSSSLLPPTRENIPYPLPSSNLTLDIHLNESQPLSSSSISSCLAGAVEEARKQTQSSLVDEPFRFSAPQPARCQFGIVGGVYVNELKWSDVIAILQGLQRFYAEKEKYVSLLIYLHDERRGALGDAYVKQGEEPAVDGTGQDEEAVIIAK